MGWWRRLLGRTDRDWAVLDEATGCNGPFRRVAPALLPQLVDASVAGDSRELRPLCDPLALGLVVEARDAEGRRRRLDVEPAARWNVAFDAAMRVAKDNLVLSSLDRWRPAGEGVFISPWGDGLDAARLCLPEIFRDVPLRGAPVAVAISPKQVMAAGADDPTALEALAARAREAARVADPPLPPLPLQLVGMERWTPCELEPLAGFRPPRGAPSEPDRDRRVA